MSLTVACMQPYFFPSLSYYRLFTAADIVIFLDDVQFPRRGRVHRCEMPGPTGKKEWLTLPLAKAPQNARIQDIKLSENAEALWASRVARFKLQDHLHFGVYKYQSLLTILTYTLSYTQYLMRPKIEDCKFVYFRYSTWYASYLSGQDRIIRLCKRLGATSYINLPGGRSLYDSEAFDREGISLKFLSPWKGEQWSILHELKNKSLDDIRKEIQEQLILEDA